MPEFQAQSQDGKLVPDKGAQEAVARALGSLRKARRFRGIAVHAGPKGIRIHQQSKGANMWLGDLWLDGYLLQEINAGKYPLPIQVPSLAEGPD